MELFLPVIFNGPTITPEDWDSDNIELEVIEQDTSVKKSC